MENPKQQLSPEKQAFLSAEKLYSDELPYHNFDHALAVTAEAMKIVNRCETEGLPIDREVVRYAAIFHDAGYHLDHQKEGFKSKEELAAALAQRELNKIGLAQAIIEKVVQTILATHRQAQFESNEEKALRAADLADLANNFEVFLKNTIRLKRESELLNGVKLTWDQWKNETEKLINFYLSQDIHLTKEHEDENGVSIFHLKARAILKQFLDMPVAELNKIEL
jgi:putative nucleotidyltransferase with HDIG domain